MPNAQNALPMDFPKPTPKAPTLGTDEAVALEMMLKAGWTGPDEFHAVTADRKSVV